MKLLLTGDLHLTGRTPSSRTDNFPDTQFGKVEQVFKLGKKYEVDYILQPGDFFDSYNPSFSTVKRYIDLFSKYQELDWYCVLGQHDMYHWSLESVDRTPLALMESAGFLNIVRGIQYLHKDISIYGCSWGQAYAEPTNNNSDFNILLIHGTIGDKPLFSGHKIENPKKFLERNEEFDLIVCGDYHFPFEYKIDDRLIINCGVLSRKSIAERNIKPSVVIYDAETREYEWIELDTLENPFIDSPVKSENSSILSTSEFVEQIKNAEIVQMDFGEKVMQALRLNVLNKKDTELAKHILNRRI